MRTPLGVEGQLWLRSGAGHALVVEGRGGRVVLHAATWSSLLHAWRTLGVRSLRRTRLRRLRRSAQVADLCIDVCVRGRRLGSLEQGTPRVRIRDWLRRGAAPPLPELPPPGTSTPR